MRCAISILAVAATVQGAVVLDRIAVIAGKHVIKTSDIERDVRLTAFLNREPRKIGSDEKRKSAERLIDQEIIRQEIVSGGYRRPTDRDADELEKQLLRDRFGGSQAQLKQALAEYGLTEDQLCAQLLWQLTVLRFIDERFRAGVLVTEEEVRDYYNQHRAELQVRPANNSFEALEPKIRSSLEGERINQNFTQWLEQARKRSRIEYRQEAFQ